MTNPQPPTGSPPRTLLRCSHDRVLGGVAAGVAEAIGVDVMAVRVAAVVLALVGGLAVPAYLAAWVLIPDEDTNTSILDGLLGRKRRW